MAGPFRRTGTAASWRAGLLLGAGMGGILDVAVLHLLLRWHHFLSQAAPGNLPRNLAADGAVLALAWLAALAGTAVLARAWSRGDRASPGVLAGGALAGWGGFNLLDGLVDHHLLRLHHVHPSGSLAWDLGFLAASAALAAAGGAWARAAARSAAAAA